MSSAPHLLAQDRPDFERVLDEALRVTVEVPDDEVHPLNSEQLRTMALGAVAAISACAAAEYTHYLRVREQQQASAGGGDAPPAAGGAPPPDATEGGGMGEALSGAGLFPVVAVLTPMLAGTAALIFLIVGYVLAAMNPQPAIAAPLRTAGWLFLVIAGAGIVFCTIGLLLTALRDGSSAIHASPDERPPEVSQARDAWSAALLERGMLPFLQEALAAGATAAAGPTSYEIRLPKGERPQPPRRLGYSRPGFSSPGGGEHGSGRPRFSSPDFSSPDYSSPDYSGPDLSNPDNGLG